MKTQPPSRKEQIRDVLEKEGKALTVDDLVRFTGIPADKIRQTLTTWEYKIVRVAPKTFDLADRVYPGKKFRYTPEKIEWENGILQTEDDVHLFLISSYNFTAEVTLVDKYDNVYYPKSIITSKKYSFSYYRGISGWYKKTEFENGDDIIFTCISFADHKFLIEKERKKDRDDFKIGVKNKKLADMVYNILSYSFSKYEDILFLFRKYLYIYPYNDSIPPDHLKKAIINDKRFLLSARDRMLSWTGYPLKDRVTIGLRKYYFKTEDSVYVPVLIESDEYGRFGYCSHCSERMIWEENTGWRHTRNDSEWNEAYLSSSFFKIDAKLNIN